jgi:hypothetical protein
MNKTKLARTFALAGFLISALFFLFWNLDSKFNFFHLPAQAGGLAGGSSQHALRAFLVKLNFVLCPPLVVTVLGMDLGTTANFLLWGLSLVLNTVLYFVLGLIVGSLWNGLARFRKRPEPA